MFANFHVHSLLCKLTSHPPYTHIGSVDSSAWGKKERKMAPGQQQHGGEYRQYLPDLSIPRFTTMQKQDAHVYAEDFKKNAGPPWLHALYMHWLEMLKEPFKGVALCWSYTEALIAVRNTTNKV